MAQILSSFLVGVGFDYDKKGANEIGSGIDSIKGKALQLGTVVAGAFGVKALTNDFAQSKDELGKFGEVFKVSASDMYAFGQAIEHEGGTLEGFMSQLASLEKMRAGLQQGDAEFIGAAGRAGLDVNGLIEATSATEGYLELADQFQAMTQSQRLNAAGALGLDDASIRLLSRGSDVIEQQLVRMKQIRDVTPEMTAEAARYNDEMQDLTNNLGGFADTVSMMLLPNINDVVSSTNEWIGANRELINQNLDTTLSVVGDNFNTLATAGGLLAGSGLLGTLAGISKYVPIIGGSLGKVVGGFAKLSALGAAGTIGYEILTTKFTQEGVKDFTGLELPEWMFTPISELTDDVSIPDWVPFFGGDDEEATPALDRSFQRSGLPVIDIPDQRFQSFDNKTQQQTQQNATSSVGRNSQLNVSFNLDGQVLERKTIEIMETQNELALSEITTSVVS